MDTIVKNTTCFAEHQKYNVCCEKQSCRQWMTSDNNLNCALIAANKNDEGIILQEIGEIFKVTRMRICQIEKYALAKLNSSS